MPESDNKQYPLVNVLVISVAVLISQLVAYFGAEKGTRFLNYIALYIMAVQWIAFLFFSGIFGNAPTEKFYDLTGSLTYISVLLYVYFTRATRSWRQTLIAVFALIWSARLGYFLFRRISRNNGVDERFTELKKNLLSFLVAWTLQGLWIFLTISGILIVYQQNDEYKLLKTNYLGIALWFFGFFFEVVADMQKTFFKANPENKDKWISTGLWSLCRHPNYFGEIVLWIGVALTSVQELKFCRRNLMLLISPAFVAFLLIFVSGIPILERKADLRFGNNEEYKEYKKNTPVLIPFL